MKGNHRIEQYPRAWTDGQQIRNLNRTEMTQVAGCGVGMDTVDINHWVLGLGGFPLRHHQEYCSESGLNPKDFDLT